MKSGLTHTVMGLTYNQPSNGITFSTPLIWAYYFFKVVTNGKIYKDLTNKKYMINEFWEAYNLGDKKASLEIRSRGAPSHISGSKEYAETIYAPYNALAREAREIAPPVNLLEMFAFNLGYKHKLKDPLAIVALIAEKENYSTTVHGTLNQI